MPRTGSCVENFFDFFIPLTILGLLWEMPWPRQMCSTCQERRWRLTESHIDFITGSSDWCTCMYTTCRAYIVPWFYLIQVLLLSYSRSLGELFASACVMWQLSTLRPWSHVNNHDQWFELLRFFLYSFPPLDIAISEAVSPLYVKRLEL